ncbi:MAG: hypothetical protein VX527_08260 [Planctomycetota bacterium]|nr:hypothetical protein [Planctomycetota bacterium]
MKAVCLVSVIAAVGMTANAYGGLDDNLIVNGSFEEHIVSGSWDLFQDIPGWTLESGPGIELQRGVAGWDAFDGEQWLELDADQNGPGGGYFHGETGSTTLSQEVQTVLGQYYLLTLSFSPRPGVADNHLIVQWNHDTIIDLTASGVGESNTTWQEISVLIEGTGANTKLILGDASIDDTYGTFVDGVRMVAVPAPATLALMALLPITRRRRRR